MTHEEAIAEAQKQAATRKGGPHLMELCFPMTVESEVLEEPVTGQPKRSRQTTVYTVCFDWDEDKGWVLRKE